MILTDLSLYLRWDLKFLEPIQASFTVRIEVGLLVGSRQIFDVHTQVLIQRELNLPGLDACPHLMRLIGLNRVERIQQRPWKYTVHRFVSDSDPVIMAPVLEDGRRAVAVALGSSAPHDSQFPLFRCQVYVGGSGRRNSHGRARLSAQLEKLCEVR